MTRFKKSASGASAIAVIIVSLFVYLPLEIRAQGLAPAFFGLSIEMTPEYPEASTIATARLVGNTQELARSSIEWLINGKVVPLSANQTTISVPVGKIGSRTVVEATVIIEDETSDRIVTTIRPTEVDLLWSANSYTPPFFRGRPLPSAGTTISAEAIVRFVRSDGTLLDPTKLIYTWRVNNRVFGNVSGRGKSVATVPAPALFSTDVVSVLVESTDGTYAGSASTKIASSDPILALYQDHPLFGVLSNTALETNSLFPDLEATFVVFPYYVNIPRDKKEISYQWSVNGSRVPESEDTSRLTIRTEAGTGVAFIELVLGQASNFLQHMQKRWNVTFETAPRNTFFDFSE